MINILDINITKDMVDNDLSIKDAVIYNAIYKYNIGFNIKDLYNALPICKGILKSVNKLKKLGYIIDDINQSDIVFKIKNNLLNPLYICEWCNNKVNLLQEHHYPIPNCKGGKDVVNICPNCHYTYHKYFN